MKRDVSPLLTLLVFHIMHFFVMLKMREMRACLFSVHTILLSILYCFFILLLRFSGERWRRKCGFDMALLGKIEICIIEFFFTLTIRNLCILSAQLFHLTACHFVRYFILFTVQKKKIATEKFDFARNFSMCIFFLVRSTTIYYQIRPWDEIHRKWMIWWIAISFENLYSDWFPQDNINSSNTVKH